MSASQNSVTYGLNAIDSVGHECSVEVGALHGGFAHELKNPLSTMGMNIELALEEVEELKDEALRERLKRKLTTVIRQVDLLQRLMDRSLVFVRAAEITRNTEDVNALIREVISQFESTANDRKIEIVSDIPDSADCIWIDGKAIHRAIREVIENALDSMPNGGQVAIQVRTDTASTTIDIVDRGPGTEEFERAFRPYFTTHQAKTGLGLSIASRTIAAHGGGILLKNGAVGGLHCQIRLPRLTE